MAPPVVTWEGLKAWCEMRLLALEPWESLALVQLGQMRASIASESTKTKTSAAPPPSPSKPQRKTRG